MFWRLINSLIRAIKKCFGFGKSKANGDSDSDSVSDSEIKVPPYSPPHAPISTHPVKKRTFETIPLDSESEREITPPPSPPTPRRGLFRRR